MNITSVNGKSQHAQWKQRWFACDKNKHNSSTSIGSRRFVVSSVDFKRFYVFCPDPRSVDSPNRKLPSSPLHFLSSALSAHWNTRLQRDVGRVMSLRKRKPFWSTSTLLLSNTGISPKYATVKLGTLSQTYTGKHMSQVCTSLCNSALFRPASRLSRMLGNSWGCLLTAFT